MEEHSGGGGDDDFGDAGDVVESFWSDGRAGRVVGLVAEGGLDQDLIIGEDAEGAAGKGAGGDGFFQYPEGRSKARVAIIGGLGRGLHCLCIVTRNEMEWGYP